MLIPAYCKVDGWMWMTCDFMFFSSVFQSHQDDGRLIMKGCSNGTPYTIEKISHSRRDSKPGPLDH